MRRFLVQIAMTCLLLGAGLVATSARPSPVAAAQPAAPPLRPYSSQQGRFSVLFPAGTPQHSVKAIGLKGGASSSLHQTWVEIDQGNVAYMVMYNDYPTDHVDGVPDEVLAAARSGAADGKTVLSDRPISLDGVPGCAFTATDHDGWRYTVHQFLAGQRLYQSIVVSANAHPAVATQEFMRSFRIH